MHANGDLKSVVLRGLENAELRVERDVLIIRLTSAEQDRLLADDRLRRDVVREACSLGFSRVALELTGPSLKSVQGGVAQPGRAGDS